MKLTKVRIKGFQSFDDSGEIEFLEGINLIIGQNNAGKSALLRALLPLLPDDRHRTSERWESFKLPAPQVDLSVEVSGEEINKWILRSGGSHHFPATRNNVENINTFMQEILTSRQITISVTRSAGGSFSSTYPSHKLFDHLPGSQQFSVMVTPINGELAFQHTNGGSDSLPGLLFAAWQLDMFYFTAERMNIGESAVGYSNRLEPNARNLPNVLHALNADQPDVFQQLVDHMREVFPTVGNLTVRIKPDNNLLEIRVWPTEVRQRVELSFPLSSSGTGVSQVLALLVTIITIEHAIIIIDEINSFLHPAAVKALLRILQTRYMNHQYVISTHAPEVISFSNPKTIHLVQRSGYDSSIKRLDLDKVGSFREVAEHLGVSMADVFAADRVVWVEGPTEELCFPYLYQKLIGPIPRGTIITSVAATGDFNSNKRNPAIVYEVYRRLSAAAATLVVSVVFSFDTEKLTETEKEEMQRKAGGLLYFLPRRHFECYLIDPEAIAAFIISKDTASADIVTPLTVVAALRTAAAERALNIQEWNEDISDLDWLSRVDAANLIIKVCGTLSGQRAPFAKKNDSLFLLQHIIEHNPEKLAPLRQYVASLIDAVGPR